MSLLQHSPSFSVDAAIQFAKEWYGIEARSAEPLPSERDQNFLIQTAGDEQFVLKIAESSTNAELLQAENQILELLETDFPFCPRVLKSKQGVLIEFVTDDSSDSSQEFPIRLITFLPGRLLGEQNFHSEDLLRDFGRRLGQLTNCLKGFDHPAVHRSAAAENSNKTKIQNGFHWDLANAETVIESRMNLIDDANLQSQVQKVLEDYREFAVPHLKHLPTSVIHNDANDFNVLTDSGLPGIPATAISGLIDWGDCVHSWTIAELAIAIAYAILDKPDPLEIVCQMVRGYQEFRQPEERELDVLFSLIGMRLCASAAIAAEQSSIRPDSQYLSISQQAIRKTFPKLTAIPNRLATAAIRQAAGLSALPHEHSVIKWLQDHQGKFVFPLKPAPSENEMVLANIGITLNFARESIAKFQITESMITRSIKEQTAPLSGPRKVAIGGYLEPRLVYSSDQFANVDSETERRTIHLGVDLFDDAGTEIVVPMKGRVKIVTTCQDPLDYGTFVILEHQTDDGDSFFSLYGHLATKTASHLSVDQTVDAGDTIGWLGDKEENGGWTPHLHFQLMLDLLQFDNFPGVCQPSKIETWSAICPDPNLILGLDDSFFQNECDSFEETLRRRRERLGGNLSLGYDKPIKMVRGFGQYLFDDAARCFLDAYNNVPHVGHCHPRIVRVAHEQMARLNTNSRYLSDLANEFAERLAATMPESLEVCYFLNSASEANELALRMARAKTGGQDMIVLDGAYHGHTTTLIDLSPYKHDGPGGAGAPDWVHKVDVADTYRGKFKDENSAGGDYAKLVQATIGQLQNDGRTLAGFIAESCPSVGGQIIFPPNYLSLVYEYVRSVGGVCIADDVQTGYGRLGECFYGFQLQNVTPDIVVLGKPMGNGHPLAAVVTTRSIADAFDNGMEFFSTFGGNNVSCAIGIEVLKVVEEEGLQENAERVGSYMVERLLELKKQFSIIGDVRGSGLFLGVELVRDHESLEPADDEASFIVNRMRDRGVLIGTDGPLHNVLKIRPPMCFTLANADTLLDSLTKSFRELWKCDNRCRRDFGKTLSLKN